MQCHLQIALGDAAMLSEQRLGARAFTCGDGIEHLPVLVLGHGQHVACAPRMAVDDHESRGRRKRQLDHPIELTLQHRRLRHRLHALVEHIVELLVARNGLVVERRGRQHGVDLVQALPGGIERLAPGTAFGRTARQHAFEHARSSIASATSCSLNVRTL